MKIGFKLSLIMAALGLFAIASVSITLLARARSSILNISKKYSVSMANDSAADITNFLNTYLYKVETGAHVMEQYRYIVMANRRNVLNAVLEGLARSNPEIIAAWCVWEPDVLEGGDLEYLGTKGAGPGGRFSPYYYWENGKVELAVMDDFEDPAYILPKKTGSHTVLDPYEFPVGRKTVLMTTVAVPITTDGKVVGVIGFDLPLDTIQRISQTQKPYPDAIAAVFSSNGTITGHPDERRIGKDMMKTEADMAGEYLPDFANAVKAGRPYTFTRYMDEADSNMIIFSVPITAGKVKTPWSYA
ncbi:MAG: cache domain-containing protein, partial [Treponema sp.]|nr:cache domain-containing protein [Treponema sp.]